MPGEPSFEVVQTDETEPGTSLLLGMAGIGVAGLTATDYLVSHVETNQIGHVRTRNLPDITPFSDGVPRHPMRLYGTAASDVTVLISEVFPPVGIADPFSDAILEWASANDIREITALYGAPFPHSETEHVVFRVCTPDYLEERFPEDSDIDPLAGGFFDGVLGELMLRSLDGEAPPMGALVTPTHLPGPDLEAALRLIGALESVYGITVAEEELRERSREMQQYYEELTKRMQALQEGARAGEGLEYPDDRMYM